MLHNCMHAGIEVGYAGLLDEFPPGKMVIRCLWIRDYPAQSEVGNFVQGGI